MIITVFDISVAFFHGRVICVVPEDLRKKAKHLEVAQEPLRNPRRESSVCDARGGRTQRTWLSETCGGAMSLQGAVLEALGVR